MKVTSLKENLHHPLVLVSRYVSSRPALPVLANILLETSDGGGLVLSATNLDVTVRAHIPAKTESAGKTTIPARAFAEMVATLPAGKVTLSAQDGQIELATENTEATFNTIPAQDFPVLPVFNQDQAISVPIKILKEVAEKVLFAAAVDESRPVLTTLLLQPTEEQVVFVATDGFRLSEVTKPAETVKLQGVQRLLLPAKIIAELIKIGSDVQAETLWIDVTSQANQIALKVGEVEFFSKLIDAAYPDYQRIIPTEYVSTITVSQSELLQAVKLASVFARDAGSLIKLDVRPDEQQLLVMAQSSSLGQNHSTLKVTGEGESMLIAFNARYLLDALNAFGDDELKIQFKGPLNPMLVTSPKHPGFRHIIMPIKVEA